MCKVTYIDCVTTRGAMGQRWGHMACVQGFADCTCSGLLQMALFSKWNAYRSLKPIGNEDYSP